MIYGTCRHDNEPNAKFCSECGAAIALRCSECDAEQVAGSKFCNQCGSSLTGAPAVPARLGAPPVDSAVRKQVTALFADLVGATAFGERVDPEAARTALAPYFEILRSAIEDHAGTVVKFTGDGVMAVFGVPEVAEDDALRAVASGRELQRRFYAFAERVREQHGVELGLRVGINTGELVIGDDDADMVGDVLNTAARLEAVCSPGQVLVGEDTWRLTRSVVVYEVLGEVRVKGKEDALATFQVSGDDLQGPEDSTPFVGRTDELTLLIGAFDEAVASSSARLVTVIGAPGVGKTRLAAEMRAAVDVRSFDLRFERRGSTTFTPVVELLRELTGSASADDIARLVGGHAEADRLATVLSSLVGHGDVRSTEESFWAVRRLLEHVASSGPIAVVVDDIQWAEPLFWDLLDHLVEWTTAPVMLVALARPELRELRPELAQAGRRVAASVSLEGLDAAATRELAARLLDTDELPSDLIDRLPASTEGNPLFVRELVQMLVDDGVLARTGDRWHLTIDVEAIEVPPTILSLLASRVERLPDDERQVVELASVIGTEFDRGLLGSIAGHGVAGRLGALIDRLRRKDLVEPSGAWVGDHPIYRFHHVLVRDAAYRRLLKGHRAELHERVGRYLDEHGDPGHELDVTVAHHYEQVHRYRSELGTIDDATSELGQQAMRRLRHAAEHALGREDLAAAGGYAQRALALATDDDVRRELLLVGCEAFLSSGNVAMGGDLVEQLAAQNGDDRLAAWTDCFRAQLWSLTDADRLDEASALADRAADRLLGLDDQAGVAKARLVRALTLARLGRVGDCEAELDLALGAARAAGDRRRTVAVLGAAPLAALWGPSPVARAGGRCLDVLRLLRITTSSPAVEATSIRCQGVLEALRGRFDSARGKLETSRTAARDLGLRQGLYETELFAGFVELWAGDPGGAEPHLRLAADGLGALGIGADAGQAQALLARALLLTGRVDEAEPLAELARDSAGQNLQTAIASRAVLAEIRAAQGRHDEAKQCAEEAIEIAERTDVILDYALALEAAVRAARRAGDTDAATRFQRRAHRLFDDKGVAMMAAEPIQPTPEPVAAVGSNPGTGETDNALRGNAAWDVNEDLFAAWIADDRDGYLALLAPDFQAQIHELGPELAFSGGRDATADVLFGALAIDRSHAIANRLVAIRGDEQALIAMTFQDGASSTTMYTVSQTRDGRAVRADTFAEDQLGDALEELDRRWVALGAPADIVASMIELRRSSADGDFARFRDLLADDFEAVGHGRLALLDRRSADEFVESLRPIFGDGGVTISVFADVPAIADGIVLTRYHLDVADGSEWRVWYLWVWESGRLARADIYELDDFETASARFEELNGGPVVTATSAPSIPATSASAGTIDRALTDSTDTTIARDEGLNPAIQTSTPLLRSELVNDETRFASEFNRVWLGGNIDVEQFLEPDYDSSSRRSSTPEVRGGREVFEGIRDFWRSAGAQALSDETMAIRGDHHALHRLTAAMETGDEISVLAIGQLGRSGRWSRHVYFDVAQIEAAQIELDRMYLSSLGYSDEHVLVQMLPSVYSTDFDVMARALHPDIEYVEHRPLTWAGGDRETLRAIRSSADHHAVVLVPQIYRRSEHASVSRRIEIATDALGETEFIAVSAFHDGLVTRLEFYPCDDLDAALSCYDELVASAEGEVASSAVTNTAWEQIHAALRLLESGDDGMVDRIGFHDDFRASSAERVSTDVPDLGADDLVQMISDLVGSARLTSARHEPIAVRADDLCLARSEYRFGDDLIVRYTVVECRDDLIGRAAFYEDTQLDDALEMLGRRWVERGGPAHLVELDRQMREAQRSGDADVLREHLHPEWTFHDRRRLGVGAMRLEQFISSSLPHGGGVDFVISEYLESTDNAVLARNRFVAPDGSEWEQLAVSTYEHGRGRTTDVFDLDDVAAARARFRELTNAAGAAASIWRTPIRDSMRNRAVEVLERAVRDDMIAGTGLGDEALPLADDFTFAGRRDSAPHFDAEAEHLVSTHRIWHQMELVENQPELVAVRGDDLALFRVGLSGGEGELEFLVIIETAADRLVHSWTVFDPDQLDEAQIELDRRLADQIGLPVDHWIRQNPTAAYSVDPGEMLPFVHPDIEYLEHRKLSFESGGLAELATATSTMDLVDHVVIPIVHQLSEYAALYEQHMFDVEGNTSAVLALVTWLDGLVRTFEGFELPDIEAALARFDELVGGSIPAGPATLENRASRLGELLTTAGASGDRSHFTDLLADDFASVTHEQLRISEDQLPDRDTFVKQIFDVFDLSNHVEIDSTVVAIRGDELCVMHIVTHLDADDLDKYAVIEAAGDRICATEWFDSDDLATALDVLDRQHDVSVGRGADHFSARIRADIRSLEIERVRPWLHPEFRFLDHRDVSWPELDADGWIEHVIGSIPRGMVMVTHRILVTTAVGSVNQTSLSSADGSVTIPTIVILLFGDGHVTRIEMFDPHDDKAALARFHELTSLPAPSVPGITNRGSETWVAFGNAWRNTGLASARPLLHPDFRFEARRASAPRYGGDRDDYLSAISVFDDEGIAEDSIEVIAIRGDHLALCQIAFVTSAGDEFRVLSLCESTADGTAISATTFDANQLDEAHDELDRRWVELGGSDWVADTLRCGRDVMLNPSRDLALKLFHPDLVSVDHRQLGLGVRDLDGWLGSMDVLGPGISVIASEIIDHRTTGLFGRTLMTAPDGESSWEFLQLMMRGGPEDERVALQEIFDLDQIDAAQARFTELVAQAGSRHTAPGHLPPLVNDDVRLAERFSAEWLARGDVDIGDYVEPDFVFAGRRRATPWFDGGPEILRSIVDYWSEAGLVDTTIRPIAIRDRHLALTEQTVVTIGGDEMATISVGEIGPSGRWRRVTFFDPDQLHEAHDLLDAWWVESGAPEAVARAGEAMRHAYRLGSPTMLRSVLSDDFRRIDHRRLGTGTCTADEMAATLEPLEAVGGVDLIVSRCIEYTDRLTLTVTEFLAPDGSTWTVLSVQAVDAELVTHLEVFDPDQLDQALELFHRLAG